MANDSIWKKEITLGRKKKAGGPPAADAPPKESAPFWKKELGGRKKAKAAPQPTAPDAAPRPAPQPVPFWKKEITLGGKKAPAAPAEPAAADPGATEDTVPFWKRDVLAPKRERLNDDPDEVPFWKREVSLGGRKQQKEVGRLAGEAAKALVPDPSEIHEPIKAAEAAAAALIADPNAEIEIFFQAPRRAAEEAAQPEGEAGPGAAPAPQPAPEAPAAAGPERPIPGVPTPAEHMTPPGLEPLPEVPSLEIPEPLPAAPAVPPAASAAPPLPPIPAAPVAPPAPVAASEPAAPAAPAVPPAPPAAAAPVVHPPVPAAELPPLPAEKVPFWKKEIGGRKKQASVPAAATLPPVPAPGKVPFWKKELGGRKKDKQPAGGEVSIWKKEITFSRKPKPTGEAAPAPASAAADGPVPFWKKEISLSRKSKPAAGAVATAVSATAAAATAAAATGAATGEKVPFWKKEIGGKKKAGAPKPKAAKAPQQAKGKGKAGGDVPFWKRDLSLKSLKEAKVSLPARSRGDDVSAAQKKAHAKSKRLVGLKVGASQIAAARVVNNGVAELVQLARQPLEQGIVVSGELRDPDALAAQLKAFFTRNKLPRKGVRLGIASNRIGVRIFDVAGIQDDKQLGNAIQFRAQEALPIPLDEAVLDYHVLGETVDAEGQPVKRILLVVAYRELVDRYVTACRKAGITLTGIDLEAFALLRALAAPRPEEEPAKAALVCVAIGHDRSTFAVSDGRVCEFTRVLEWGGSALNIAMARALDLAPSEVEGYKRSLMLDGPAPVPEGLSQEQWSAALEAVRRQLQSFARELVSSLQFYQNQPGSLGIGEIVLAGGTAHMPGLAEELQRLIGVHVRVGDPLARVKVAKKVGATDQIGSLAIAIGLGIED